MRRAMVICLPLAAACSSETSDACATDPAACERPRPCADTGGVCPDPIKINEVMSKNDGAWVDSNGETDDWIELVNSGTEVQSLLGYSASDDEATFHFLPPVQLDPGAVVVVWADGDPQQGAFHLPFKLSSAGETLYLWSPDGRLVDRVALPAVEPNDALARFPDGRGELTLCRFASPGRTNGATCEALPPPEVPPEVEFADYTWPIPWPALPSPLAITELALDPASFIEVTNSSAATVDLSQLLLTIAAHGSGLPWPDKTAGVALAWPTPTLGPGERVAVPVDEAAVGDVTATAHFEGVVTLFDAAGAALDRVDFMAWPTGATLARESDAGSFRFCKTATAGAANDACDPLPSRPVPDHLRHFYTPGDFGALAAGGTSVGMAAVKFVVDMAGGDVIYLLSAADWDLHYTFVREQIDGDPHLDRCDPVEAQAFYQGWAAFSQREYYQVDSRRYLLGSLVHHTGASLHTIEFATGDRISPAQIRRAFFDVVAHDLDATLWALRPEGAAQIAKMQAIEGTAPIVDPAAPFRNVMVQLLTEGIAYGVLQFVSAGALDNASLGVQAVVITDQVPNDIPLVGGLVTETFQTPLSHVNVLSRNRGTPNMALRDARSDPRIAPYLDTLVRLEVRPGSFDLRAADPVEAQAYWDSIGPAGPPVQARLDTTARGVTPLDGETLDALPALGAKAAQLAELARVASARAGCPGPVNTPRDAAAIPVVHSLEHYQASGAADLLAAAEADPRFGADPRFRADELAEVRAAIMAHPVDPVLLDEVCTYIATTFGQARTRFRSSSNVEDLQGFGGAGLYTSVSGALGDFDRSIEDAIRTVWASLYNARAFDERLYFNVDESTAAMGILIHEAFLSERANGIGISRNVLDPVRSDIYYLNAQVGEASVANPAPGITSEQLIYRWGRSPRIIYHGQSNLPGVVPVLSDAEDDLVACTLRVIHDHFEPLLDPLGENRWFAMDIEFKLIGTDRSLMVKQARPYTFGSAQIPADCREF